MNDAASAGRCSLVGAGPGDPELLTLKALKAIRQATVLLVDDLVVCGAEPLFLTDYIATGRVVPERIAAIVKGAGIQPSSMPWCSESTRKSKPCSSAQRNCSIAAA